MWFSTHGCAGWQRGFLLHGTHLGVSKISIHLDIPISLFGDGQGRIEYMSIQNSSIVGSHQGVICNGKTFLALVHSRFIGAHGGPETRRPNYRKGYLGAREFRSSVVIRATSLEHTQTITNQTETLTNASCRMLRLCDFLHNMLSGVPPENTPENPQVGFRSKH